VKTLVISNADKRILYVSDPWVGKTHDYRMLKEEFPVELDWFSKFEVLIDLGFLGFEKDYETKKTVIPIKKPKGKELSIKDKKSNKEKSSVRVKVEHAIGGMKRYRVLSDRLRMKNFSLYNDVVEVCSGLWNFLITD